MPQRSATVRCVVDLACSSGARPAAGRAWSYVVGIARGLRRGQRLLADQRPPLGGEAVREQAAQRHLVEGRVGDEGVAVGVGELGRLEVAVQRLLAGQAGHVEALKDVERLADGRAARGRRGHAVHVEAAVVDLRRLAPDRLVAPEVVAGSSRRGSPRAGGRSPAPPAGSARSAAMSRAIRSAVEAVRVFADARVGLARGRGCGGSGPTGAARCRPGQVELAGRGEVVEDLRVVVDLPGEDCVDDEPLARDPRAGPQQRAQGAASRSA